MQRQSSGDAYTTYTALSVLFVLISLVSLVVIVRLRTLADVTLQEASAQSAEPSVDAITPSNLSGSGDISIPDPGLILNEGVPVSLYVRGTVSDPNGCADLDHIVIKAYRSGATGGSACTPDKNDCYTTTVAHGDISCSGVGDTDATFEVTIPVENFADPTDSGSEFEAETWVAEATVHDADANSHSLTNAYEVQSLGAFDLDTSALNYGVLALGELSSQKTVNFTNTGNRLVDAYVEADDDLQSNLSGFDVIQSTAVHYSLTDTFAYGVGTAIEVTPTQTLMDLNLAQQTNDATPTIESGYFLLQMPPDGISGTYTNTLTFTAYAPPFFADNPLPILSSISPTSTAAGGGDLTVTLTGSGFVEDSQVQLGGSDRATTYVDESHLTATILESDLMSGGTRNITVVNPAPGGGTSEVQVLTVTTLAWTERRPAGDVNLGWGITASSNDGRYLLAGVINGRLYTTSDYGANWTERQPAGNVAKNWQAVAASGDGTRYIVGVWGGRLYVSANDDWGATWVERQPAGNVDKYWRAFASSADGSRLVAGVGSNGRLYTTSNYGANWTERQPAGNVDRNWYSSASSVDGLRLIVGSGSTGGRLYTTSDYGANWTERQPAGNVDKNWRAVASSADGSHLIAAIYIGRIYTSSDYGVNWTERQPAGDADRYWQWVASSADGSRLVAAGNPGRLYVSTNYGATWVEQQPAGASDLSWTSVASNSLGTRYIAGRSGATGRLYTSP